MSADAWRICPQCHSRRKPEPSLYGKVSEGEYLAATKVPQEAEAETLREDYEIFMQEDGVLYISYGCSCEVCGFEHSFKHEKLIKIQEASDEA